MTLEKREASENIWCPSIVACITTLRARGEGHICMLNVVHRGNKHLRQKFAQRIAISLPTLRLVTSFLCQSVGIGTLTLCETKRCSRAFGIIKRTRNYWSNVYTQGQTVFFLVRIRGTLSIGLLLVLRPNTTLLCLWQRSVHLKHHLNTYHSCWWSTYFSVLRTGGLCFFILN